MFKTLYHLFPVLSIFLFSCSRSSETDFQNTGPVTNTGGCNTANVKFTTDIASIMQANCNSCHNSTRPLGGVKTDDHSSLKMIADNGLLVGTITHAAGFSAMPKAKPKLPDCDINKIKAWIAQGTKNN